MESLHIETRCCREIPHKMGGNVNVICNADLLTILWNKYKLIKYDKIGSIFDSDKPEPHTVNSEFAIEKVLLCKDNLLCLDCSGNLNINTITLDSELSSTFKINKQNVIACALMNDKYVVCMEIKENFTELSVNEFDERFLTKQMFTFSNPDDSEWKTANRVRNIMSIHYIPLEKLTKQIRLAFDVEKCHPDHYLIVICLDKINVYACIISQTQKPDLKIVKLYKSQSEIVGVNIYTENEICVLVGLSGGNIIKIPLNTDEPKVVHLNTALYKFGIIKNAIIYTDGLMMWKTGDVFSNSGADLKPEQFFVKNVRDFCIVNNKIICSTFSNLIYCFCSNDRGCYINPANDVCGGQSVTNSYLGDIMHAIQKNQELVEKINKERQYLMALSLSNRQSIMNDLIQITSYIFENFSDVEEQIKDIILTDNRDACDTHSYYFIIKISVTQIQHKLNKLLSDVLGDIKIHITLFENKVLKTTSIQINEQLKDKNFVIPLKRSKTTNLEEVQAIVKIVTNIPAKMDEKQRQWIILYRKCIYFNADNFVRTNRTPSACLKEDDLPLETLICNSANHLHGTQYKFDLLD